MIYENEFMSDGKDIGYKESIYYLINSNYKDVIEYVNNIIPAKNMEFPKEVIDSYIKEIAFSVANTIDQLPNGIRMYTNAEDPTPYYHIIAERITYGTIFLISKSLIASLLKIISPIYVFNYIKSFIVLPNVHEMVEQVLKPKKKDNFTVKVEKDEEVLNKLNVFLKLFIVNADFKGASEILDKYYLEFKEREDIIRNELRVINLAIPDVVYRLLFSSEEQIQDETYMEETAQTVKKLQKALLRTHTTDGLTALFKSYCVSNITDNEHKIPSTIKEIRAARGFNNMNLYIDDISIEELEVVQRIMDGSYGDDLDISRFESKTIIENFRYIKTFYSPQDQIVIENDVLKLKDFNTSKIKQVFRFKDVNMIKEHKSVFNIFKDKSLEIKNKFYNETSSSVLTQTVIINDPKSPFYRHKMLDSIPKGTLERINHRKLLIKKLKHKLRDDDSVRDTVAMIEFDPIFEPRFIKDIFKSSPIVAKTEKAALFIAAELDRIYELACSNDGVPKSIHDEMRNIDSSEVEKELRKQEEDEFYVPNPFKGLKGPISEKEFREKLDKYYRDKEEMDSKRMHAERAIPKRILDERNMLIN